MFAGSLVAQVILWERVFDPGNYDYGRGAATDRQGNIIVVGDAYGGLINHDNWLLIKYNSFGDTIWTRRYDTSAGDIPFGVACDRQDNIVVVGGNLRNSGGWNFRTVKYSFNGNILWSRTLPDSSITGGSAHDVTIDSKGSVIVTGEGHYSLNGYPDYATVKYDSSGNLLWVRFYDGGYEDYAEDVAVDDSDNIVVTGYSNQSTMNWDWCTIKYSPIGDTLWIRRYDVGLDDWAHGVTTDRDRNIIVVGEVHNGNGQTGMVVKYTPKGDTIWSKLFTDTMQFFEVTKFLDVTTDKYGNIYLAGDYASWDTSGRLWFDYYTVKCNSSGDTLWTMRCDVDWVDETSGIALDSSGNIIVNGTTSNPYQYPYRIADLTVKIRNKVEGIYLNPSQPEIFGLYQNFPNPFNPATTIQYRLPKSAFVTLQVFDVLGRNVANILNERQPPGVYTAKWDAAGFSSGVYIIRLLAGNFNASRKLVRVK